MSIYLNQKNNPMANVGAKVPLSSQTPSSEYGYISNCCGFKLN